VLARFGSSNGAGKLRHFGHGMPIGVCSQAGRRHHRRKEEIAGRSWNRNSFASKDKGDDKVEINIDLEEIKQKAGDAVAAAKNALQTSLHHAEQASRSFVQEGAQAWKELGSSVAVQNDKRIVIAVRCSTIEFAGCALLWIIFSVILAQFLLVLAKRFQWGWEESFNWPRLSQVRDRSLGGKEVVVSKGIKLWESRPVQKPANKETRGLGPLDSVIANPHSEKELHQLRNNKVTPKLKNVQGGGQLPVWWLASDPSPSMHPEVIMQAQRDTRILLHDMMEKRINGIDFAEEDICKLQQLCRDSGAKVSFDIANTRDSFYRSAIQVVLNACSSTGSLSLEFGNEEPTSFIAGLANNIGLSAEKAATMVIAAMAARTRAGFLQAWALHMQGKPREADEELQKLVRMHATFSSNPNSAEMELVARGLSYLGVEERRELLIRYTAIGGSQTESIAREALGLQLTMDRS